jgi:hypothetical protein
VAVVTPQYAALQLVVAAEGVVEAGVGVEGVAVVMHM